MNVLDRFRLDGKRILVTGGSRGFGRVIALAAAEAGADVILVARDPAGSRKDGELRFASAAVRRGPIAADIAEPRRLRGDVQRRRSRSTARSTFWSTMSAAATSMSLLRMPDLSEWRRFIDLNLTHCFLCTKMIGGAMLERREGRVINIASISGMIANRGIGGRHYETSKAAVIHFTRSAAADWAPRGVTVNAICPGLFMTEPNKAWAKQHPEVIETFVNAVPMGRAGDPEEIGPLAVYLASPASSYVTGAAFVIDGGYTLW